MATSPLFGWEEPDDVDLVKDGAAAMRTLGNAIDTSMGDLLGGTSGQILAKASNTNMDFTWITNDVGDITAVTAGVGINGGGTSGAVTINNSMLQVVDAKGDLVVGVLSDEVTRLPVGSNGQTLVADSTTGTGLRYQDTFAAGKNKIINGAFNVWQRGTSFTTNEAYTADRFVPLWDGTGAKTISQQSFTAGTAPVTGYESQYFLRFNQTTAGTGGTYNVLVQKIEDVRTLANQTATFSFWAKAAATTTVAAAFAQNFGSGGSGQVNNIGSTNLTITTAWTRFSITTTIPSISGKTIGTGSFLQATFGMPTNATFTVDIWGVQVEVGSVATAFQTSTGTIQGELAACQRYCYLDQTTTAYGYYGNGTFLTTTQPSFVIPFPVTMRGVPSALASAANTFQVVSSGATGGDVPTSVAFSNLTPNTGYVYFANTARTAGIGALLQAGNTTASYLLFTAEL